MPPHLRNEYASTGQEIKCATEARGRENENRKEKIENRKREKWKAGK
jgi:hypothetical protein